MGSNNDENTPVEQRGIIPRVLQDILESHENDQDEGVESVFKVSFVEIYQEQVH
jgi:hypothetical protein